MIFVGVLASVISVIILVLSGREHVYDDFIVPEPKIKRYVCVYYQDGVYTIRVSDTPRGSVDYVLCESNIEVNRTIQYCTSYYSSFGKVISPRQPVE